MGQNQKGGEIMKFSKKHFIVGLIGNLLVFAVGLVGIVMLVLDPDVKNAGVFQYFTTLSNVFVALISLINTIVYMVSIAKGKNYVKEGLQVLKLIAVVSVAITFTMVLVFLMPHNSTGFNFYAGSQLFLHAITPITAVVSFIFLEYQTKIRFRFFFMPIFAVLAYGAFYVTYAFVAKAGTTIDWYGFMFEEGSRVTPVDITKFTTLNFLIFLGESLGGALVFGFVFWLLNKIMNLIFIGYTIEEEPEQEYYDEIEVPVQEKPAEQEETQEETKKETKPTSSKKKTTSSKAKTASAPKKYKDGARVYHISRSKFVSRSWQIKLANGEKAIKIFPTQAEAIAYAKQLVKSQGGSIRIHSMKGQLRK